MPLKKRAKVSAEFNMSSLTDIIFLLLIFFMLTSTLVAPNSLNLKLPGTSQNRATADNRTDDVSIDPDGSYFFNNRRIDSNSLDAELQGRSRRAAVQYVITISPEKGAPVESVTNIMDMALRYEINAVLAAEE